MDRLTAIILVLNSLVPFLFSIKLRSLFNQKQRDFYNSWALGFFFCGLVNLMDSAIDVFNSITPIYNELSRIISFFAFIFLVTGIGQLVRKPMQLFVLSLAVPSLAFLLTLAGYPMSSVDNLINILFLGFTFVLYYLRIRYKLELEIIDLGWVIILLANVGYTFNQISLFMTIVFSLLGKTIAFIWMTQDKFIAFTDQIEFFVGSGVPSSDQDRGTITVLESSSNKRTDLKWIVKSLNNNSSTDSRKIFVVTSNLFSEHDMADSGILEVPNIHIVRMDSSLTPNQRKITPNVVDIANSLDSLKVSMLEIIDSIIENDIKACFMIYNISTLIHTHGWRQIYSLILSTIPKLKDGKIITQIVISPETHENSHEVNKILLLANKVMKIAPK